MPKPFIPEDFVVPEVVEHKTFRLRMLCADDLDKDYEAVMESLDRLKGFFGPKSLWPKEGMTKEDDLNDLRWHEKEFTERKSFAYTVTSPDESRCLGCVYIFPSRKKSYDADVFCWVRSSEVASGLDNILFEYVKKWVQEQWPFEKIAFPGREIGWQEWEDIK